MTPPLGRFEWERLIRELPLTAAMKNTAYALATYVNGDGTNAHPGVSALSTATGLHRATVIRALSELEVAGFIHPISRGGGKDARRGDATVYELSVPVDNSRGKHRRPGTL